MPEAKPHDKPVIVLSPSQAVQSAVESVYELTETTVSACASQDPATRFDLQANFVPIVEEAKRLYENVTSRSPEISSHGAVFQKSPYVGRLHDTIVIPIVNKDNAKVTARDERGNKVDIVWEWSNYIFAQRLTYIDVEKTKRVGAIVVHFRRN